MDQKKFSLCEGKLLWVPLRVKDVQAFLAKKPLCWKLQFEHEQIRFLLSFYTSAIQSLVYDLLED